MKKKRKIDQPVCYNDLMTQLLTTEIISGILTDFPAISLVYLFGSQVTGNIGPMSDYDLAILGVDDFDTRFQFQHAMSILLNTDCVDVVLLNIAPVELAYHIISSGTLLYQKDIYTRVEFEAKILGKYGDYLPILRLHKKETLEGGGYAQRVQWYREALGRTQRTLGAARTPQK